MPAPPCFLNRCSRRLVAQAVSPAIAAIDEHAYMRSNANLLPVAEVGRLNACPALLPEPLLEAVGGAGGFACDCRDRRACLHALECQLTARGRSRQAECLPHPAS